MGDESISIQETQTMDWSHVSGDTYDDPEIEKHQSSSFQDFGLDTEFEEGLFESVSANKVAMVATDTLVSIEDTVLHFSNVPRTSLFSQRYGASITRPKRKSPK